MVYVFYYEFFLQPTRKPMPEETKSLSWERVATFSELIVKKFLITRSIKRLIIEIRAIIVIWIVLLLFIFSLGGEISSDEIVIIFSFFVEESGLIKFSLKKYPNIEADEVLTTMSILLDWVIKSLWRNNAIADCKRSISIIIMRNLSTVCIDLIIFLV